MGYRKYAKDYEIEYVSRPGKKRAKAVRVYVGPYFRFKAPSERIVRLKWLYLIGLILVAAVLAIVLAVDCPFTRTWYIQAPVAAASIPWIFAACAAWRLWTAGEQVEREHCDLLHDRMSGATLVLTGLCAGSAAGCILRLGQGGASGLDYVICACCLISTTLSVLLFSKRKELEMESVSDN